MPDSTQPAVMPNSHAFAVTRLKIVFLFIPLPCISFVSFILSKPIGQNSLYLIPAGLLLGSIHQSVVVFLMKRKPRATEDVNSPEHTRFAFLHHLVNISIEVLIALVWLAGGTVSLFFNVSKWDRKNSAQDIASASLAIVEGGLLTTIAVYSWKLRKQAHAAQAEASKMAPVNDSVDGETAGLIESAARMG
ncbi:hypothetical protein BN14_03236 [Rhizoctonia solani AG-1 IB]|uniref:Uncharacterized protein n=1 Tax=Thanatephorus cucumeris (strain AG1-IB / isolate 7/3/14) TaxID=1108050 RepID=M5BQ42_THACB|nr:hypothetical protein BN14_03236 [Rhizoctonia solani AG-1 IB]